MRTQFLQKSQKSASLRYIQQYASFLLLGLASPTVVSLLSDLAGTAALQRCCFFLIVLLDKEPRNLVHLHV
jgi:hypothetical protein